jgi:hypothetical protein
MSSAIGSSLDRADGREKVTGAGSDKSKNRPERDGSHSLPISAESQTVSERHLPEPLANQ